MVEAGEKGAEFFDSRIFPDLFECVADDGEETVAAAFVVDDIIIVVFHEILEPDIARSFFELFFIFGCVFGCFFRELLGRGGDDGGGIIDENAVLGGFFGGFHCRRLFSQWDFQGEYVVLWWW